MYVKYAIVSQNKFVWKKLIPIIVFSNKPFTNVYVTTKNKNLISELFSPKKETWDLYILYKY